MEIKLNNIARLSVEIDEEGKPLYCRMIIDGMPLQSRSLFGGIYPSEEDIIEGLLFYGFFFMKSIENIDCGILPQSVKEEIHKLYE